MNVNSKKAEKSKQNMDAFVKWVTKIQDDFITSLGVSEEYFKKETILKPNEYQCEACKGVFEKGWSDEEALNEAKELFATNNIKELFL